MKIIKFHIIFFIFWFITFLISYVLNIGYMGAFFGTLVGVITDPIVLFFGILCGLLFSNYRNFLIAFLFYAVAINLTVEFLLLDWHSDIGHSRTYANLIFTVFVRSIALLILAVLSNMIRVYFFIWTPKIFSSKKLFYKFSYTHIVFIFFISLISISTLLLFYFIPLTSKKLSCEGEKLLVEKANYQSFLSPRLTHINCPPKNINGYSIPDIDCLNSQKIPEEFTYKSFFSGSIIFNDYLKFFGFSLSLIDDNESNNELTNFSRNDCEFVSTKNVICSNQFGDSTAKVDFDITSQKLTASINKLFGKINYDLTCNKLSEK